MLLQFLRPGDCKHKDRTFGFKRTQMAREVLSSVSMLVAAAQMPAVSRMPSLAMPSSAYSLHAFFTDAAPPTAPTAIAEGDGSPSGTRDTTDTTDATRIHGHQRRVLANALSLMGTGRKRRRNMGREMQHPEQASQPFYGPAVKRKVERTTASAIVSWMSDLGLGCWTCTARLLRLSAFG